MPDRVIRALLDAVDFAQSGVGIAVVGVHAQDTAHDLTRFRPARGRNECAPQQAVSLCVFREILQDMPTVQDDFGGAATIEQGIQFGEVFS